MTFVQGGAVLLVIVLRCCINAQNITNTTLHDGDVACADTDVTFTCETVGSSAIAWRSENFIGAGNTAQLIFSFDVDSPGRTRNASDSTTVATLTRSELVNGIPLLESTLRVRAPANSSTSLTVTCVHLDNDEDRSVKFTVLSIPGEVIKGLSDQVQCINSSMCLVISSWSPPFNSENTTNFTIYVNGTIRLFDRNGFSVNSSSGVPKLSAFCVVPTCDNHVINITASNICGEGLSTAQILQDPYNTDKPHADCGIYTCGVTESITKSIMTTSASVTDSTKTTMTNDSHGIKCFIGVAGAMLYGIMIVMLTVQ